MIYKMPVCTPASEANNQILQWNLDNLTVVYCVARL
jgi:Zn ribbon nucleic-acid-binding protein